MRQLHVCSISMLLSTHYFPDTMVRISNKDKINRSHS